MQKILARCKFLLLSFYCYGMAAYAAEETIIKSEALEEIGSAAPDLQIGKRLLIATVFLIILWLGLKYLADKIKAGEFPLPKFLTRFGKVEKINSPLHPQFNLEPIQQKIFPDGSELFVIENNGRYLLLSKTVQSGIQYLCELENPQQLEAPISSALQEKLEENNLSQI